MQDIFSQPFQHGDAGAEGIVEIQFPVHRTFRDGGDFRFQPGKISEFVNTFDGDHSAVHIGKEQLLAPVRAVLQAVINTGRHACRL